MLAYLLVHRDRVVSKQELLEQLWPDQFIGDAALISCIKTLRQALEERGPLPADTVPQAMPSPAHALHPLASQEASAPMIREIPQPITDPAGDWACSEGPAPLARVIDGEHKQVTVLCGALAEALTCDVHLELETLHHLMQAVVALVHATLQHYDGALVHVSGESFLALFGAPVAQEDHARRAGLAVIELQQRAAPGTMLVSATT